MTTIAKQIKVIRPHSLTNQSIRREERQKGQFSQTRAKSQANQIDRQNQDQGANSLICEATLCRQKAAQSPTNFPHAWLNSSQSNQRLKRLLHRRKT